MTTIGVSVVCGRCFYGNRNITYHETYTKLQHLSIILIITIAKLNVAFFA